MLAALDTAIDLATEPALAFKQRTRKEGRSLGAVCGSCWGACGIVCVGSVLLIMFAVEALGGGLRR